MMEYNFQYILDLYNTTDDSYEKNKLMHMVDTSVTNVTNVTKYDQTSDRRMLFHTVAIMYSFTFITGLSVYVSYFF